MAKKAVSFSTDVAPSCDTPGFKTWPRRALKNPKLGTKKFPRGAEDTASVVFDVFNRFRTLADTDTDTCLQFILDGECEDPLVSYSVLSTILKSQPPTSPTLLSPPSPSSAAVGEAITEAPTEDSTSTSSASTATAFDRFDGATTTKLLARACTDFEKYAKSSDVLDSRVLQQIMRAIEALWMRNCVSAQRCGRELAVFADQCVDLIVQRPGSKLLLSPAVRISNLALEDALLNGDQTRKLISALASTHFAFAAGFSAESMMVLATVQRVQPVILRDTVEIWVALAVRALVSASNLTRSLALHLLDAADARSTPFVALALHDTSDSASRDDPLIKLFVRKFCTIISSPVVLASPDDVRIVAESWSLVLASATRVPGSTWPYLDHWIDAQKNLLKAGATTTTAKVSSVVWTSSIAAAQTPSFCRLLLAPFAQCVADPAASTQSLSRMLAETMNAVDTSNAAIWQDLLIPVFKMLSSQPSHASIVLSEWSRIAAKQRMPFIEQQLASFLELFTTLFKSVAQQTPDQSLQTLVYSVSTVFSVVAQCGGTSRSRAMEIVRTHYHLLSQPQLQQQLCQELTSTLVKTWPLPFLTERPKNTSFSLLTLVLLPVVLFSPRDRRSEHLDRLLAHCKSESALRSMLLALLHTVHAGSDNLLAKWMVAGSTIREYVGSSRDPALAAVCVEALLTFVTLANDEDQTSATHWSEWTALFSASPAGRAKVLVKLKTLPPSGMQALLALQGGFNSEKQRIIVASLAAAKPGDATELIKTVKDANLPSDLIDAVSRDLVAKQSLPLTELAVDLIPPSRIFVIAKPVLAAIADQQRKQPAQKWVQLWNTRVAPLLAKPSQPAFLAESAAAKLARDIPELTVPREIVIPTTRDSAVSTPSKKRTATATAASTNAQEFGGRAISGAGGVTTPPPSLPSKRARRTILTGSVPPSSLSTPLSTPPVSSDPPEEAAASSNGSDDMLCSSPPQRSKSASQSATESWRNSQQERARTLKRVMMGLDMDEAVQDMKRSEQEMIYNLMFRSCVKLRTYLAATGPALPSEKIEGASEELQASIKQHEALVAAENLMIENGKRRALEIMESQDSEDDFEDEDDDDEYVDSRAIKLEV